MVTTKKTVKSGGYAGCADHAAPVLNDQTGGKNYSKNTIKGGNIAKDVSNLLVPFGLILAKESLEQFLKKEKSSARKPSSRSKKVSLQKK